jgi:tRNA (guanine-N7-)-methyltransferase
VSRRKLYRFKHNQDAHNVIEAGKPLYTNIKGQWNSYFDNDNPIILELACGKGEYTVGLAKNLPKSNVIGIDIKGDRIARGSKRLIDANLKNGAFLRTGISYLNEFFEEKEVAEIWLIHPDPQPGDKQERKRLTNQYYLDIYKKYLKKDGLFRLKTDSPELYEYSLKMIKNDPDFELMAATDDLYHSPLLEEHFGIQTHYEQLWVAKGYTINYIKARLLV